MSKSRRSNPVPYRLAPAQSLRDLDRRIIQVRRIFASYRKQARAGYVFRRETIKNEITVKFFHDAEACEAGIKAFRNLWDKEADKLERFFAECESPITVNIQRLLSYDDWSVQDRVATFNANLDRYNTSIRLPRVNMACGLETFLKEAYGKERIANKLKKNDFIHKGLKTTFRPTMKFDIFKELKQRYPYISAKNKIRLIRLYNAWFEVSGRFPKAEDIRPPQLIDAGIPAAEVVGPWFIRTKTVKGPMDWIREKTVWNQANTRSPGVLQWLLAIGLDSNDHRLADSMHQYYHHHGRVPSAQWARQRNNELEEERKQAEIKDQIPDVESWLKCSREWRKEPARVDIPDMPDPTFHVVEPREAADLCLRARRDGLCVIDVIVNELMDEDPYGERPEDVLDADELADYQADPVFERSKAMGVCTLIISTDPKRRTVVGLNEKGICTSEHHCTGVQNKVDKLAWEYFKGPA
ncbi:MAG: hypothetical protein WC299_16675 [Kiritimatiellia bacterium]